MNKLFKDWDASRIFRLVLGLGAGLYAIISKDTFFYWFAGLFIVQAVLNWSCCGAGGCSSGNSKESKQLYHIDKYKPKE